MARTTLAPKLASTPAPGITLADAINDYLFEARKLQPTTHRWYTIKLSAFLTWCHANGITTMEQVTAREVRRFLDAQTALRSQRTGTPLAAQTHRGTTQVIKQFFALVRARGLLSARSL